MIRKDLSRILQRMEGLRLVRLDHAFGSVHLDDDWNLDDDDLTLSLVEKRPPPLLFNHFTPERVRKDLADSGILARIAEHGYRDVESHFEPESFFESRFRVTGHHALFGDRELLLVDCRTHQGEVEGKSPWSDNTYTFRVLFLDWVNFQDPARTLPARSLKLPGQQYPGLGIFRQAMRMTLGYVREMGLDAAVNIPEYFHNAVLYAPHFRFFNPQREGRCQAMKRDLLPQGLAEASTALAEGRVALEGGRRIRWTPAEQVYPIAELLHRYFNDARYLQAVAEEKERSRYQFAPETVDEPSAEKEDTPCH